MKFSDADNIREHNRNDYENESEERDEPEAKTDAGTHEGAEMPARKRQVMIKSEPA